MLKQRSFLLVGVFALGGLYSEASQAGSATKAVRSPSAPTASQMVVHGRAAAPFGHIEFCLHNPGQCARNANGRKGGPARLNARRWHQLRQVNARINRLIRPSSDQAAHGQLEVWSANASVGDCEDYALRKRKELMKLGWPASAVLIATARDRRNRRHAVLIAHTSRGDFVLDNLTGKIRPWNRTGYKWLKRQSTSDPRKWVSLTGRAHRRKRARAFIRLPRNKVAREQRLNALLNKIRSRRRGVR